MTAERTGDHNFASSHPLDWCKSEHIAVDTLVGELDYGHY